MDENKLLPTNLFDDVVAEYRIKQKEVVRGFVYWCIELWEILLKYREILRKGGKRMEFLDVVWLHIAQATQQIRLFELSKEKIEKDLLAWVITNREKLNLFLALTDEQKELVMAKGLDENTTSADFRSVVAEIKTKDEDITSIDTDFEDDSWKKITEKVGGNPLLVDTKRASKHLQEQIGVSIESRELVEWILFIEKAKEVLRSTKKLDGMEKEKMKDLYVKQLGELETIFTEYFN